MSVPHHHVALDHDSKLLVEDVLNRPLERDLVLELSDRIVGLSWWLVRHVEHVRDTERLKGRAEARGRIERGLHWCQDCAS